MCYFNFLEQERVYMDDCVAVTLCVQYDLKYQIFKICKLRYKVKDFFRYIYFCFKELLSVGRLYAFLRDMYALYIVEDLVSFNKVTFLSVARIHYSFNYAS